MRNILLFIKITLQFIVSTLTAWREDSHRKEDETTVPLIKQDVAIFRHWKSISIYRNLRLILKMLDITSWNYKQSISLTKKSLIQKQVSWIAAFLLLISINVSAQIAQRGTSTTASIATAAAAMTINKPTGVVAGDVMIATVLQNETDNDNGGLSNVTSTGWTLVDGRSIFVQGIANNDNAWHGTVLYRVADGTEGASFAFALPNSRADMAIGSIVAFSGATSTGGFKADGTAGGPFDADPGIINVGTSATASAFSINAATSNSAVIMLSMVANDRTHSAWAATSPTSLTELNDNITTNQDDGAVAAAWAIKTSAGAIGNGTVTLSASDPFGAMLLALRPAASVAVNSSAASVCGTSTINLSNTLAGNMSIAPIGFQGFESTGSTMTYTVSGGNTQTGTIALGEGPASSPYGYNSATGYRINNGTATVTFANVTGLASYTNKSVTLDLASFSLGSQTNGADNGDNVTVAISLDGGTTYSNELNVNGNSNAFWGYTTGTGVASATYDGNNTPTAFTPGGGGNRTTDGYSNLVINLPNSSTQVRVRVTMFNDNANEVWAIDDVTLSGTPTPVYSWTSSPAGFTSSAASPTSVSISATTTYNLTVTDATGFSASGSTAVTFVTAPNAGTISGTQNICIGGATTFSSNGNTGGAWSTSNAAVATVNASTGAISGVAAGTATITYTVTGTAPCTNATATRTVTVAPNNTAGAASSTPTLCINTALTNITHTTTGASGIGTVTGLPAGVAAAWASNTITISGTPTAAGTFSYTIPLTGGCGSVNATGTITVLNGTIDYANLQFPGSQTICIGNNLTAYGRIYEAGVTEAAGANAIVEAQVGYNASNTNPNTWAAGNWTNATYNVQSGNDDEYSGSFGSALAAGTYYYAFRYRMNGCAWQYGGFSGSGGGFYNGSTNINGVLTISPNNTVAAASSTPTLCINTALTNITHATTGATGIGSATGLPAGVAASWNSNTITIYGTPSASGTFLYSVPLTGGCASVNATGTITVTPANTILLTSAVGTNAQLKCVNSAITNITYSTAGASGATFSGLPSGVSGAWAANVVTISGTPTAYGFYNYTVTLTGGCGSVTATGSINVNGLDYGNLQSPGSQTICVGNSFPVYGQVYEPGITEAGGANVNIVAQIGYNTSNTDPSTWPAGNWTNASYNIQSGNNDEYVANFGAALAVGTYYYTFRYSINGCSYQYAGAFSGFWNGTSNVNGVLTVSPNNTVGVASSTPTVCINTAMTNITHTTTGATGILNAGTQGANGLPAGVAASWNSNTITIYGTPSASGTFNYSIPLTGGCGSVNATGTITVTPNNTATLSSAAGTNAQTRCINTAITNITYATTTATGATFSGLPTGVNGNWATNVATISGTPTVSGTFNYTVTLTGGCSSVTATGTITVTPANTISLTSAAGTNGQTVCRNTAITNITYSTTGATGATFSGLPAGVSGNWAANVVTISGTTTTAATYNYTVTLIGGCGAVTATGSVIVNPLSVGGTIAGSASRCAGTNTTTLTLSGNTGAVLRWESSTSSTFATAVTNIANTTTTLTATNLNVTTYYRAVVQSGVCSSTNSSTATITITQPGSGTFAYSNYGFCTSTTGAQAVASSNFTGVAGAYSSSPAGLNIDGTSGAVTPSTSAAGAYVVTYTIPASGGCAAYSTTTNVTIDRAGSGTISYTPSTICTGTAGTVSPTITGDGGSGASTWFTAAPGTITMDANGVITPSSSAAGSYTITYSRSSTGLCPTYSTTTSVTVNASPTISSSTPASRCGAGSVVLGAVSSSGTVNWFDAPTGGTNLGSGITFNTPSISTNTTYYADAVSVNGCVAGARTAILATVFAIPTIATTTPASRCGTGTVTLSATASAGTLNWYDVSTGGTILGTGASFTTPSISSTTNYFVETVANGCSSARSAVTATIFAIPTVTSTTPNSNCGPGTVTLGATSSAGTINWYNVSTGGSSLGTGTSFTTPSISTNTPYYVDATENGCTSPRTAVIAGIATSPSISSFVNGDRCDAGTVNLSATPSSGATIKWYSAATGGTLLATGNSFTTPSLSTTTTYYAEATAGACIQPSRTAITATINANPVAAITADYCSVPGIVVLSTNLGMAEYSWSTGASTQSINVDQAGNYTVVIKNSQGCASSASISVATELVTNGSFDAGNTGFTTAYNYVTDISGFTIRNEMYPEGTYAVVPNANLVHNAFNGQDRNGGSGNILVINGSPTLLSVWNQNNISVVPNTTYYFSAWAMSVVNGNNAILQFSINGSQVGTIAYLPNGYTNDAGPYTWVRFYGQWESGPLTSANLSIVNLNTIAGGNDFALDDISFGTMSPIGLSANPILNGNSVCQNDPLILNAGALGGASPFTYSWTGPNSFTSTSENPLVTSSASSTQNGTYTVVVTDGFGCTKTNSVSVTVSAIPNNVTVSAAAAAVCSGGSTNINLSTSEIGVYYQLRNNANNASIGALVQGTGSAISLPTGVLTASTTFNVLATRYPANCDRQMSNTVPVTLSTTPEINITNQAVCSGTVNLTASAVTAGSTGSGTLTYWIDLAATTAVANPTSVGSGTYFIRSTNGACSDIEPVVVSVAPISANFTIGGPYCTTGTDPLPTITGTAGVFSSTTGLVFVNTNTGEIDLSASSPGTYNIVNTITPSGACAPLSQTRSVTITAAPLAGFNYISNDLCQSINPNPSAPLNVAPIFDAGAAAGTFSTSAGLTLNTTTGVINVSTSTPGNYAVVNTRAATGGCLAFSDTTFLDVNPYTFTGAVTSSSSDDVICLNENVDLYSNATSYATVLLREKFNGSINNWITTNNSTGGTFANAAWTLRDELYNYGGNNYSSNDDSRFYMSNSQAQGGGGNTSTILRSPVMSTIGFSTLSLDFFHFYDDRDAGDNAKVQISTNNTTWTDLVTYTSDQGSTTGFLNAVFDLNAYIGLPTIYIRFVYTASNDRAWAIDNVSVTGNSINYGYAWATSPVGFTSTLQNPTAVAPTVNSFYTVTATNTYGCSSTNTPVPVTVNPLPADNAGLDQNICGSGSVTLGNATTAGNTYVWTPAATLSSATIAQPLASPVTNTTYTLTETITATGCSATNIAVVTVTPLPTIISTAPAGRCGTGTVTLSAVSSTGTMKWYANPTGGLPLGTANSFTTPSISVNTTYYAEATTANCVAASRVAVVATINAAPTISSQSTAAASYSQNVTATALSVTATAGSGTITGYQWYSNAIASNAGGTLIPSATTTTYTPSTAIVGTLYYYCVVTNSNGCTVNSAVSGAIIILVTPAITSITGSLPVVSGQAASTGYRGQIVTINGTNFESSSTVSFNGVSATSVTFVNTNQLTAVVNNVGINSSGNAVVTNTSNGAFTSAAFNYIGYLTSGLSSDWSANGTWLGNLTPTTGSNATIAHANTCNSAVTNAMNLVTINAGASLTFGSASSALTTIDIVVNNGSVIWTNSGTLTIGNTLTLSPTAVFTAGAGNVVYNKAGDQQLFSGQSIVTFNNVSLAGSGNKSLALNTDIVVRNLIINTGTTFNLSTSDSEVLLRGDLIVDGNLAVGTSNFQFVGTVDQQVSLIAAGGTAVFSSMKVNKTAGLLLMNDNIQVQDSLIMVQGNINTQGYILEVGSSITQRGTLTYTAGYVNGKMRRWYAAATNASIASGIFPIGEFSNNLWESRRAQLNYTVAPSNGGHLTIEFIPIPMIDSLGTQNFIPSANTGGAGFVVSNFSNDGYWKIDNLANTLIDGEYNISLTGEGFSLPGGLTDMTIVKRVLLGDWFCPGTHLAPTGNASIPTLRRSGVSGFSNFGYAGGPNNALPITLVNFDGTCDGEKIQLNWSTESESNNKEYQIESSYDAYNWTIAEIVPGANNSNTLINYSGELRLESTNGIYIRLRQVDFNGNSKAFDPIFVKCGEVKLGNSIQMYPNPTLDISRIEIQSEFQTAVQLCIFSSNGQIVLNKSMQLNKGKNLVDFDMSGLAPGAYFVKLSNNNHIKFTGDKLLIKQ